MEQLINVPGITGTLTSASFNTDAFIAANKGTVATESTAEGITLTLHPHGDTSVITLAYVYAVPDKITVTMPTFIAHAADELVYTAPVRLDVVTSDGIFKTTFTITVNELIYTPQTTNITVLVGQSYVTDISSFVNTYLLPNGGSIIGVFFNETDIGLDTIYTLPSGSEVWYDSTDHSLNYVTGTVLPTEIESIEIRYGNVNSTAAHTFAYNFV